MKVRGVVSATLALCRGHLTFVGTCSPRAWMGTARDKASGNFVTIGQSASPRVMRYHVMQPCLPLGILRWPSWCLSLSVADILLLDDGRLPSSSALGETTAEVRLSSNPWHVPKGYLRENEGSQQTLRTLQWLFQKV